MNRFAREGVEEPLQGLETQPDLFGLQSPAELFFHILIVVVPSTCGGGQSRF
jgi:hypothetical protein